ncbi:MAG TPA: hypothetical protein PKK00_04050 [Bacteroidales bacterium]|nr:hypothetical protein [Bacteroidales bacterium]HPS16520.1 hypothetical protein [Bacteroidales bacterium]
MKKLHLIFLIIIVTILASCLGNSNKPDNNPDSTKTQITKTNALSSGKYKIKSGIIEMNIETMGMIQKMKMYFDDFGNKECVETNYTMDMGIAGKIEMHSKVITGNGYIYNIDLTKKSGTKTKITTNEKNKTNDIDFNNMDEKIMKEMHITKAGTEKVMDKTCDKFNMNNPELKMKSSYSVWNGIPLKYEMNMSGIVAKATTTKIEENATIPAEIFEIPADIKITEIK